MKITEKINFDINGLIQHGPINIVAFGDSVTHGAVGPGELDYETVYWNRLKQKIHQVRAYMPVNVINAGIGGITAKRSLERMEQQVFDHHPDLVIVCFGLNDVNGTLEDYLDSLRAIFARCKENDTDTIFMTPNMLNTHAAPDTEERFREYSYKTAEMQTNGRMDTYMAEACKLARAMGITVCDCYSACKKLNETQDITMLLANRINHPTREMHALFADMLFETIFADMPDVLKENSGTMWSK